MKKQETTYRIQRFTEPLATESGAVLPSFELAYESWGVPRERPEDTVVVLHALSGSSHALSSPGVKTPGWWQGLLGGEAPLGPARRFVICSNLLGGCSGSTGPSSIDPTQGQPYAVDFPALTIGDLVESQRRLLQALDIPFPVTLVGGSMGGMLALEWAVRYPEEVYRLVGVGTPGRSFAQTIALRAVQREAILNDPGWKGGRYYPGPGPTNGMALARKIGMITYRSAAEFEERFGRAMRDPRPHFLDGFFEVQSYLNHQGGKFVDRFDANTYLYYSRAMDLFDLSSDYESLAAALARVTARCLLVAIDSDFLCPLEQMAEVEEALKGAGRICELEVIRSIHGHDGFLIEAEQINQRIEKFLETTGR